MDIQEVGLKECRGVVSMGEGGEHGGGCRTCLRNTAEDEGAAEAPEEGRCGQVMRLREGKGGGENR